MNWKIPLEQATWDSPEDAMRFLSKVADAHGDASVLSSIPIDAALVFQEAVLVAHPRNGGSDKLLERVFQARLFIENTSRSINFIYQNAPVRAAAIVNGPAGPFAMVAIGAGDHAVEICLTPDQARTLCAELLREGFKPLLAVMPPATEGAPR